MINHWFTLRLYTTFLIFIQFNLFLLFFTFSMLLLLLNSSWNTSSCLKTHLELFLKSLFHMTNLFNFFTLFVISILVNNFLILDPLIFILNSIYFLLIQYLTLAHVNFYKIQYYNTKSLWHSKVGDKTFKCSLNINFILSWHTNACNFLWI